MATGAAATAVGAQALDVTRHVIAGGAGVSSGGNFSVAGSISQREDNEGQVSILFV